VTQSRSRWSGEDKFLALTGFDVSVKHAFRRCIKCVLATAVMIVISQPMELITS
jgi:hypothetical protein